MALYDRTRKFLGSQRVRIFLTISLVLHLAAGITLVSSQSVRDFFFKQSEVPELEVSSSRIAEAMRQLRQKYTLHVVSLAQNMTIMRTELQGIMAAKIARLEEMDKEPLPEGYLEEDRIWRLDPKHLPLPAIAMVETPDLESAIIALSDTEVNLAQPLPISLEEAYDLCIQLELNIGRMYERYLALDLAEHPSDPVPVHQGIEVTRQKFTERRAAQTDILDAVITSLEGGKFGEFKDEVVAIYLESEDIKANSERWLDFVRSKERNILDGTASLFGSNVVLEALPPKVYTGHIISKNQLKTTSLTPQLDYSDPAMKLNLGNQIGNNAWAYESNWLSIDRWYIIGPFEHPDSTGRSLAALRHKYPPESSNGLRLDLDAKYLGKRNQTLTWKYRRFDSSFKNGIEIEPYSVDNMERAIWYFYTEVASDADKELAASFASDDFGVCWINGQEVYNSGTGTQPFVPFNQTSFRVINLKKGINKLLFKLENNTGSTGFGCFFMTYTDPDLIQAVHELNNN